MRPIWRLQVPWRLATLDPRAAPGAGLPRAAGVAWFLRGVCLLVAALIVLYPLAPESWFIPDAPSGDDALQIYRAHDYRVDFHALWSLEGWRWVSLPLRVTFAALLSLLLFWPVPRRQPARVERRWRAGWAAPAAGLVAAGCFWMLRVNMAQNLTFGDAPVLVEYVEAGWVWAGEVLTYRTFLVLAALLRWWGDASYATHAIALTSCLAGGVFVTALAAYARSLCPAVITATAGLAVAGYAAMFFGYLETTQLEVAAMAAYFAAAARFLSCGVGAKRVTPFSGDEGGRLRWLAITLITFTFALKAHAAGVLLVPSLGVLLLADAWRGDWRRTLRRLFSWANMLLVGGLVVLPYVLTIVVPFYMEGAYGNITGGGDNVMFVPVTLPPEAERPRFVYYGLFSGLHLADIGSSLLLAAPLAVPLLIAGGLLAPSMRTALSPAERGLLATLAAAAAGCGLVPLLWNHDFGMWGDWNIAACYLFPLNVLAWTLFLLMTRTLQLQAGFARSILMPLVLAQAAFLLGLLLQFY